MGNKRKASLFVIVAIIAALAVFPFLSTFAGTLSNAAVTIGTDGCGSVAGTAINCNKTETFDSAGTYLIYFYGQNGESTNGGKGAACLAFYKGASGSSFTVTVGKGGGTGYYEGGGYTSVYSNFAKPSGASDGYAYAAGGGGGGGYFNAAPSFTPSTSYVNASFDGYTGSPDRSKAETKWVGEPASRSSNGRQGKNGNSDGELKANGIAKSVCYNGQYNESYKSIQSGGGGAGLYSGGGGGHPGATDEEYSEFNARAYTYAGGGGVCSANCYPVYAADTVQGVANCGYGKAVFCRIDPSTVPVQSGATVTDPSSPGTGRLTMADIQAKYPNISVNDYIATDWVYGWKTRTSSSTAWSNCDWGGWSTSVPTCPVGSQMYVSCRYVIYAKGDTKTLTPCYNMQYTDAVTAAKSSWDYIIHEEVLTITNYGTATVTKAPTVKTDLVVNFTDQEVIDDAGSAENGVMEYSFNKTDCTTVASAVKRYYAGTYTLYYRAKGSGYYNNSEWSSITVTIAHQPPNLTANTLAGLNPVYSGSALSLFSGKALVTNCNEQPVYYAVTTSDSAPAATVTGTTTLSDVKGTDAYTSDGAEITYYLWGRCDVYGNFGSCGWKKLKTTTIQRATLSVSATLMPDCNYDGQPHQLISSVTVTPNSSNASVKDNFTVKYKANGTYCNTGGCAWTNSIEDTNYASLAGTCSGKRDLSVSWTVKSSVTNKYNYLNGSTSLGTVNINKIDDTSKVTVTGITAVTNPKLGANGTCTVISNASSLNMTVCSVAAHNGISSNNDLSTATGTVGWLSNWFRACLSTDDTAPTDVASYNITGSSLTDMNNKLKAATVNSSGTWYLYLYIAQHNNLKTGTKIRAATFTVDGLGIGVENLTGFAPADTQTYNGNGHKVYTGNGLTLTGVTGSLGTVKYAVTTSASSPASTSTDWVALADVPKKSDVGTYYLHVKWAGSGTITAGSASMGTFEITPYSASGSTVYFSGVTLNWGNAVSTSSGVQTYQQVFKNSGYTFGTAGTISAGVTDKTSIPSAQFGTFTFAVGTSSTDGPAASAYKAVANFSQLTKTDVGTYYLWIKWDGKTNGNNQYNVTPGARAYRYKTSNNDIYTPAFQITQLTANTNVALAGTYATTKGSVPYQYTKPTSGTFTGTSQALFDANGTPAININSVSYSTGVSYQYLLSTASSGVTASTTGWVDSIAAAKKTDVAAKYYLWVKIAISSTNVSTTKVCLLISNTAAIVATSSFVDIAPTPITGLKYDGNSKDLITASSQSDPDVEYSLNGTNWYTDAGVIEGTAAGTYKVYYRGAARSPMFTAQAHDANRYVSVTINSANAGFNTHPTAISNVVYTGRPITATSLFTAGTTTNSNVSIKYSWDKSTWVDASGLAAKSTAGSYTLYYKLYTANTSVSIDTTVEDIAVEIIKANILVTTPTTNAGKSLIYKAANYHLFLATGDYGIVNSSNTTLTNSSDVKLTYANRATSGAGTMGTIYYGYSTSATTAPTSWKTTYTDVVVRTVGKYYVWMKVDAGTNHNGKAATCYNTNSPITIVPCKVNYTDLDVNYGLGVTGLRITSITGLRYTGQPQNLISALTIYLGVPNRNDNGEVLNTSGNVATTAASIRYNNIPEGDVTGTMYYYLSPGTTKPAVTDFSSTGWQENWDTLTKTDEGTYYLCFMLVPSANSNLGETLVCTSMHHSSNTNIYVSGAPKISPATYDDINKLSGIVGLEKMYTGTPQTLASGTLTVTHITSEKNLTSQITGQTYCFVKKGNSPPNTSSNWTAFADTKVTNVDEYQLYVKLTTTNNIDSTTKPLIYPLLGTNYAEIVRVDADKLNIVAPGFVTSLVYNGSNLNLLNSAAKLEMKSGKALNGALGAVTYYISGSPTAITATGTTAGGETGYTGYAALKEKHVGTYYIWVGYAQGDSHVAVAPRCVGSVSITQATMDQIKLSGITFKTYTYNGENHKLTTSVVTQTFDSNNKVLGTTDEYSKIEYAYSNDPEIAPANDTWVDEADLATLTGLKADKYYIWVRVTAKTNSVTNQKNIADYTRCYSDVSYSEILRATLSNNNFDGVLLHRDLVYIAENQVLASIPEKLVLSLDSSGKDLNTAEFNNDLTIYWALGTGTGSKNAPATTAWTNDIKENQGKDHGDYYLWVWVPESKNINEYEAYYATISIDKATIHFTQKPVVYDDLVYTGDYQELVSAVPVIKFHAEGTHYDPTKVYYDAFSPVIEYRNVTTNSAWSTAYRDVNALDAKTYTVAYRVAEGDNWYLAQEEIDVVIAAADASKNGVGLIEAPKVLTDLAYNETEQDLISFGILSDNLPVAGRGAALEGSKIVFYYADDDRQTEYKYYYDTESGKYVWDSVNGPLPGRSKAGNYTIKYYVTASPTGNFKASAVYELNIVIAQREIYWKINPQSIYGLKFTSSKQPILIAGELNVGGTQPCDADGVRVLYTLDEPGSDERKWQEKIPEVGYPDLWYVWYRVEVNNNNVFVGPENNDEDEGTMIVVLIEKNILTIRDLPRPNTLQYTAEEQSLVDYYYLSTNDIIDLDQTNAPFIEYSFDKNASDEEWSRVIKAKDCGEYIVYYRLNYNSTLFEFKGENDGSVEPMQLVVAIETKQLNYDSLHAVFNPENGGTLTYKADTTEIFNSETGEYETVPMYSDALLAEIENNIQYFYRKYDEYTQDVSWLPWVEGDTNIADLGLGTYQFMLSVITPEGSTSNFNDYTQTGYLEAFDSFTIKEDRVIQIIMPEKQYNTPAYVRAWIDLTLTTKFDDAKFKFEGWVDKNGKLEIPFLDVDSTGRYGGAVIRLQTVNASYYYMSEDALSNDNKAKIELTSSKVKNVINAFNPGLIEPYKTIYLYEIYRIQYDANGGIGDDLEEGWKWHNIDYRLEENKFTKTEDGKSMTANGWNTSKAGNGNNYNSGSMYYRENASQVFYAKFFKPGENFYTVEWIIDNGSKRYTLSRDFGVWFDTANPNYESRDTGMLIAEGELIVLPQVQVDETDESLSGIFGGYILGWHTVDDSTPYSVGMTATRNVTFIAELSADLNNYVECEFKDEFGDVIHYSGQVADGAKAYMALSGMSANTINEYYDGYTDWVQRYGFDYLDASKTPDGVLRYDLGAKTVIEEQPATNQEQITWDDYVPMFIILALGVVATVASLTVYIIMRKKRKLSI